jgi:hypothetical protein
MIIETAATNVHMSIREIGRRRFIQLSASGVVGLALWPSRRAEANGPLVALLSEFTLAVGATVIANSITEFLRSVRSNAASANQIRKTNAQLAYQGFTDQSYSTVCCSLGREQRIYYPIVNSKCSCLNFTAPFIDMAQGGVPVTMIQGPHLAGLRFAADMLLRNKSQTEVSRYLMPDTGIRLSLGTPQAGYDGPLIYNSLGAKVEVAYTPQGAKLGVIEVKAIRHADHVPVVNDEWRISFP